MSINDNNRPANLYLHQHNLTVIIIAKKSFTANPWNQNWVLFMTRRRYQLSQLHHYDIFHINEVIQLK